MARAEPPAAGADGGASGASGAWIVLQLADSAFPTGGYAHSAGLEAVVQAGELASVEGFCAELVAQLGRGALPLAGAAHDDPARLAELDALAHALAWSHVARRASIAQGRALLDVAARAFARPALRDARAALARGALRGHLAPVHGAVARAVGASRDDALRTLLHLGLRGALSAAVRLGCAGPAEAQGIHARLHPALERAWEEGRALGPDEAAQTAPLVELVQGAHDRLYSRLFQS